jgi:predicted GNAT family N-acyltransferase
MLEYLEGKVLPGMLVKWKICSYAILSKQELHQIMILRQKVFVVEQDCPYQGLFLI